MKREVSEAIDVATLAGMIDHTFLKAAGDENAIQKLCQEVEEYGFACAMVHPAEVVTAKKHLEGSSCKVGTVVGFPLGQNTTEVKCYEALSAIEDGADEIDYVVNLRFVKAAMAEVEEGKDEMLAQERLKEELEALVSTVRVAKSSVVTKLIIETCYLTDDEKVLVCKMAKEAGFDFVKTSTGFGTGGAVVKDVELMRKAVGEEMGVKASGGIRNLDEALAMIRAGATRLGCSAGVAIIQELEKRREALV